MDIDALVAEGVLSGPRATELRRSAKQDMTALAIDLLLFTGMIAVVAGTSYWLDDSVAISIFGAALVALGVLALAIGPERFGLIANASSVIGGAMFIIGSVFWIERLPDPEAVVALFGLAVVLAAFGLKRLGPPRARFVAGCLAFAGLLAHHFGVWSAVDNPAYAWIVMLYVAATLVACGTALDVRLVTALAILPLSSALSASTFYQGGRYGIQIGEPTLMIVLLGAIAIAAAALAGRAPERYRRHASTLALYCFLAVNMAFWIGSIWGDTVGVHLWGPRWEEVTEGLAEDDIASRYDAMEAAVAAFAAKTVVVGADAFAVAWALVIVGVGAWAAATGRRGAFNMAAVFGGIHFYTQYFERLDATPGAFAVAGVIAILAAWGLWRYNARATVG